MFNKKNYLLNCDVCDTRKIKEEDYSGYEKMMINADIVVVNAFSSASCLTPILASSKGAELCAETLGLVPDTRLLATNQAIQIAIIAINVVKARMKLLATFFL